MSKHSTLTEKEMLSFTMNCIVFRYIEFYKNKMNLDEQNTNILDWGCGRGRSVAWLRERGYNAFGVDIDPEPIENGRALFLERGLNPNTLLTLIDLDAKTNFPDNFFHFVFSEQVFEHIKNIDLVAAEIRRVTTPGSMGFHIYPAHRCIIEPHLFMPFIHWLPNNNLRRFLIFIFCYSVKNQNGKSWREKVLLRKHKPTLNIV